MTWYERYGWTSNPFEIEPMPDLVSGFKEIIKDLLEFVRSGDCCFLIGETGTGKTVILKWLEDCLSRKDIPIYLNVSGMSEEKLKKINIDKIIKDKSSSLFGKKKMIVMLIDDAQHLPAFIGEAVKRNFDNKTIDSVVLASTNDNPENLKGNLLELIGNRKIELRPLTFDEAMELIVNRVRHRNPFELGGLEIIFRRAGFIPRNILELCELIAKASSERVITKQFVQRYFESKQKFKTHAADFMVRLSPLQKDIVSVLKTGNFTPSEIAKKLNKPTKTITSQLAYLSLKSGIEVMKRKGIEHPIVEKVSDKSAVYRLTDEAK